MAADQEVGRDRKRDSSPRYFWREDICAENNDQIFIGKENYMRSADGFLMPARKDQAPPDLRHFK